MSEAAVPTTTLEGITESRARLAAGRSRLYRLFAACFSYPDEELAGAVREGELVAALRDALAAVDPALAAETDASALADAGEDADALAVEFTRLFDVGASGPPCPLYGGLWGGARMKTMEEAVRFYNHFGLTLAETPRELPDHLTTELEFLHFLAFREAEAREGGDDPGAFLRAQRDFLERHPGRWLPRLRERLEGLEPLPFFRELVICLERFVTHDARYLRAQAGAPAAETSA